MKHLIYADGTVHGPFHEVRESEDGINLVCDNELHLLEQVGAYTTAEALQTLTAGPLEVDGHKIVVEKDGVRCDEVFYPFSVIGKKHKIALKK